MFNLFKKKTKQEQLRDKYQQLMKEAHRLSTINRTQSDLKYSEADAAMKELESLRASNES